MTEFIDPNQRLITPDKGIQLFAMQMEIFPQVSEEVTKLSGGSVGVLKAIIFRMGDAISEDPMQETTVDRVREVIGAPESEGELEEWRTAFWDAFKQEQENRSVAEQ